MCALSLLWLKHQDTSLDQQMLELIHFFYAAAQAAAAPAVAATSGKQAVCSCFCFALGVDEPVSA